MRKSKVVLWVATVLMLGSWPAGVRAGEDTSRTGQLTVPWAEFKDLLDLGEDRIVVSLETFQKLQAQTGLKAAPPILQGGSVVLSRAEFENLVNQMKPPVSQTDQLPFEFLITRAVYDGTMRSNHTEFSARFTVHVLRKETIVKVPVMPATTALQDIKVDGNPALLLSEGGYLYVLLSQAGAHEVVATFSVPSSLDKGPHKIDLLIQSLPITLLTLELPQPELEVEIPQAQQVLTSSAGGTTSVKALLAQASSISVRWRKKSAPTARVPSKLYSEVTHLVSIEDDALRVTTDINLNILYSEIDGIRLAVPPGLHVLTVTGEGTGERQESSADGQPVIVVPFTYGRKDNVTVRVTSELPLSESGLSNVFTGMRVLGSERETGFIGIVLNTSAEVVVAESEGIEEIAVPRLPRLLVDQSSKPLTLGFKYLKHPFRLSLDVKKHDKIAVPVATINSANVVTLFTEDGKVVHRLVYQVRNSAKQFLEIQLPKEADVWTVFVDQGPVESSISGEGKLLVPLIRSRPVEGSLSTFPVEVIYCLGEDKFSWMGSRGAELPAVDLLVSQLIWSVYLPNDYTYHYFTSTLEKEEIIRGINLFSGAPRQYDEKAMREASELGDAVGVEGNLRQAYKGKDYASSFRNAPLEEKQVQSQLNAELAFGGRLEGLADLDNRNALAAGSASGILPIQIQVPTGGQVYRFAKSIVKPADPLVFEVQYSRAWVTGMIKWILAILAVWLMYLNRKWLDKSWVWVAGKWQSLVRLYSRHEHAMTRSVQSPLGPFILAGLAALLWPVYRWVSFLLMFVLWVSLVYHVLNFWKRRVSSKAAAIVPPSADGPAS